MAEQLQDYRPVTVRRVGFGDAEDAVEWELGFTLGRRQIAAHGLYWRIDGVEYAVFSRAPMQDRAEMEQVFDVMVATVRPR